MKNKFDFLTAQSIKSKLSTKAFKIANIFMFIVVIALVNIDSVIKFFGGEFDDLVHVYVVDEVGAYDEFKSTMDSNYLEILENYNAEVSLYEKSFNELKESVIEDETKDIIIHIKRSGEVSYDNVFDAEFISYGYVDALLYNNILTALNTTKRSIALKEANISQDLLDVIDKEVEVERVLLNEELDKNDELMELFGSIVMLGFILPIFMLIVYVVQMIGAEINEEKSSKSMEIIISSVSPQTHFLSKLVAANIFALIQGVLLLVYILIGLGIKVATTGPVELSSFVETFAQSEGTYVDAEEVKEMIANNNIIPRIKTGLPVIIVIVVLTFIVYTLFIGILASVTTSMEDFNQVQTPVMIVLTAGYFLAVYAALFKGSVFIKAMSFVPFISGILSPVLYILGHVKLYEMGISILILAGVIFVLYKYGLKVYKVGILNYSSSNLWKKIFKALKD